MTEHPTTPSRSGTDTLLSGLDQLIVQFDQALRTLTPGTSTARRSSPADALSHAHSHAHLHDQAHAELSEAERRHAASLMRINHTGEVCAQALYQGQALTARLPDIRHAMEHAAGEEVDHLAWCEQRLQALDSHTSYLNPVWYAMSFGLGAVAGLAGDKWSLGFVAETEQQVCDHLRDHLEQLPPQDERSRAILGQMLIDERAHGESARQAGGAELPMPVKLGMTFMSFVMKKLAYRI